MSNKKPWNAFERYLRDARKGLEDKWAPVALICVQANTDAEGGTQLKLWNDSAVIWPKTFPLDQRGPLLKRIAKPYEDDTVLRDPPGVT